MDKIVLISPKQNLNFEIFSADLTKNAHFETKQSIFLDMYIIFSIFYLCTTYVMILSYTCHMTDKGEKTEVLVGSCQNVGIRCQYIKLPHLSKCNR